MNKVIKENTYNKKSLKKFKQKLYYIYIKIKKLF